MRHFLSVGFITAPGRNYLAQTLRSYRLQWDVTPVVYAEPGTKRLPGVEWIENSSHQGVVQNWLWGLLTLPRSHYYLMCEDDIEWKLNTHLPVSYLLRSFMLDKQLNVVQGETIREENIGFISPYCSQINGYEAYKDRHHWMEARMPRWGWCGALCMLIPDHFRVYLRAHTGQFLTHSSKEVLDGTYRHLDYAIGQSALDAGLRIITHAPSLITHTGDVSTNEENNTGPPNKARVAFE